MPGRECYHCRQYIEDIKAHDCWTTTEEALTRELSDDLQDAWMRLRETATSFGDQRIYASHKSIMFSRKACYFFVRPKPKYLEVCFFLGRSLKAPLVKKQYQVTKRKVAHLVQLSHADQAEAPITDWLREAYETSLELSTRLPKARKSVKSTRKAARKSAVKRRTSKKPAKK